MADMMLLSSPLFFFRPDRQLLSEDLGIVPDIDRESWMSEEGRYACGARICQGELP
jgi:hypothetical protein